MHEISAPTGYVLSDKTFEAIVDKDGAVIELELEMAVRRVQAHPAVHEDCGRVAIMRGPLVFCAEEQDNGENLKDIRLPNAAAFREGWNEILDVPTLKADALRRKWPEDAPLYIQDWDELKSC